MNNRHVLFIIMIAFALIFGAASMAVACDKPWCEKEVFIDDFGNNYIAEPHWICIFHNWGNWFTIERSHAIHINCHLGIFSSCHRYERHMRICTATFIGGWRCGAEEFRTVRVRVH